MKKLLLGSVSLALAPGCPAPPLGSAIGTQARQGQLFQGSDLRSLLIAWVNLFRRNIISVGGAGTEQEALGSQTGVKRWQSSQESGSLYTDKLTLHRQEL